MRHRLSILVFAALVAVSCSVKEDRSACPIYVSVKALSDSDCLVSFFALDGSLLECRFIAAEDMCSGNNVTRLERGEFYVSVLKDKWDMALRDGQVVYCREGREAAPVYAFSLLRTETSQTSRYSDDVLVEGVLKKQHALVRVRFTSESEEDFPYAVEVSGRRNGFDLVTLEGCEGEYLVEPLTDDLLQTEFILTRQSPDDPIYLILNDSESGEEKTRIDLGSYITQAGYDWSAESLDDMEITVDYSQLAISVTVTPWEEENIEIFGNDE